jgi:hypothetical protein
VDRVVTLQRTDAGTGLQQRVQHHALLRWAQGKDSVALRPSSASGSSSAAPRRARENRRPPPAARRVSLSDNVVPTRSLLDDGSGFARASHLCRGSVPDADRGGRRLPMGSSGEVRADCDHTGSRGHRARFGAESSMIELGFI